MSQSLERLFSPSVFDILSPMVAFLLVIVLPTVFAFYVIIKVLRGYYTGEDGK